MIRRRNAKRVGVNKIRDLLKAGNTRRIGPITMTAVIAYLEAEVTAGRLFPESQHAFDRAHNLKELRKLYAKALPAFVGSGKGNGNLVTTAHGASFHLLQLAILQGLAASTNQSVEGIEVKREVHLFSNDDDLEAAVNCKTINLNKTVPFVREVDILMGQRGKSEVWREVKSWKSLKKNSAKLLYTPTPWTWKTGKKIEANENKQKGSSSHKQISLDHVALKTFAQSGEQERNAKNVDDDVADVSVSSVRWHFHKFKTKGANNPSVANLKSALQKEVKGLKPKALKTQHIARVKDAVFVLGSIDLFLTEAKTELAEGIKEEVANQLK